ncbi:MAG: Wzy polymerase domain-containing protein [Methylotenera sp.]
MSDKNKNLFSYISLISLLLMFSLPFLVSYHKWPESTYYSQVLAFTLGVLSIVVLFKPASKGFKLAPTTVVPILLILLLGVQWFAGVGVYWQETSLGALYLFWAVMLMLVATQLKEQLSLETIVTWLAYALLIGGLANVIVVLMQLFGADDFFWTFRRQGKSYTGNLAQVNLLTDYLSLTLASIFYLHIKNRLKTGAVYGMVIFLLVALTLTGSRMSWLYILLITLSFYVFGRNSNQQTWQTKSKLILWLPLLYGSVQFVLPMLVELIASNSAVLPPAPTERLAAFASQESVRMAYIKEALAIASQHLLLGVGWGQYVCYDLIFADTHTAHTGFVSHTHNLFVQILVECGLFALLVMLIGSIYWFVQMLKQNNSIERWWLLLVGGIIFTHSMLEYPLWYAHFLGIFAVIVALADKSIVFKFNQPSVIKIAAGTVLVAALSLIVVTTYQYRQIEYWVNQYPNLNKQQRVSMLNEMTMMHQKTLVAEPLHLILTRAYSILPSKQAPLAHKIAEYERVLHYMQAKEDIYRYVLLLAANGQIDKATAYLKRAYVRHPAYAKQFAAQLQKMLAKPSNQHNSNLISLQQSLTELMQQ